MARRLECIDQYMRSISGYQLISREREKELAHTIHGPDPDAADEAANELVCANLRLVVKLAHDFGRYTLGFSDLVSEGNIGLMKAARKFDPEHGAKFSVYAGWWIKQAMRKAIADKTRTIRLPTEQAKCKVVLERCRIQWREEHNGDDPTDEQLSEASGVSLQRIVSLGRCITETVSMDELVAEGGSTTFTDMLGADDASEETRMRETRSAGLESVMGTLCDMDRLLIRLKYGIGCRMSTSLEIAQEIGSTSAHVDARLRELLVLIRSRLAGLGVM